MFDTQLRCASVRLEGRFERHVRADALGHRQPGPFADQHHDESRSEGDAHVVADGDATVGDDRDRGDRPVVQPFEDGIDEGRTVSFDRERRQSVAHDDRQVVRVGGERSKGATRVLRQDTTEIRPPDVLLA